MRCNCFRLSAVHLAETTSKPISALRFGRRTSCMSHWAQDWSTALEAHASDAHPHGQLLQEEQHTAVTHTPHPAAASSREAAEWEAVLTATEASAVISAAQPNPNEASRSVRGSPLHAVVECGSHCTRLLLSTGVEDVARLTVDAQLGVAQQQQQQATPAQLDPTATAAALRALHEYSTLLQQHNVVSVAAVATAAVRTAADALLFVQEATDILGCQLQILSGTEEGQLAFIGATSSLAGSGCCCLVFDLGGSSTEFAVGRAGEAPTLVASIPLGCLSVQTRASPPAGTAAAAAPPEASDAATHCSAQEQQQQPQQPAVEQPGNHHDQQWQQELQFSAKSMLAVHQEDLQAVLNTFKQQQQQSRSDIDAPPAAVIGTGGTITTIAALQQQLAAYQHEAVHMSRISQQDVAHLMHQLEAGGSKERLLRRFPWLTAKRYDSLLVGCCGVLAIMQQLGVQQVLVSDCDLLDGMMLQLQQTQQQLQG